MRALMLGAAMAAALLGNVAWLQGGVSDDGILRQVATFNRYDLRDTSVCAHKHVGTCSYVQRAIYGKPIDAADEDVWQQGGVGLCQVRAVKVLASNLLREIHPATGFVGKDNLPVGNGSKAAIVNICPKLKELRGHVSKNTLTWQHGLSLNPHIVSGARTDIFEYRRYIDLKCVTDNPHTVGEARNNSYPRPLLVSHDAVRLGGFLGRLDGGARTHASSLQSSPNEPQTNSSHADSSDRSPEHAESPKGHSALGGKVAFGALGFLCGLYYLTYAFRKGGEISVGAGAFYALLGTAGVFFGGLFCILGIFGI
ncbi:MAG: hypothetical protein JJ864_05370 [Rhizobiaceae bacterium]|nr:hypothetical protein [Rhizobiaceae bacterium]